MTRLTHALVLASCLAVLSTSASAAASTSSVSATAAPATTPKPPGLGPRRLCETLAAVRNAALFARICHRSSRRDRNRDEKPDGEAEQKRQGAIFAPLAVLVLWMGIYPATFLDPIEVSVANLVESYNAALAAAEGGAPVAAAVGQ